MFLYTVFSRPGHIKIGITSRLLGHRISEYNTYDNCKYYIVYKFNCYKKTLENIEKTVLWATRKYAPEDDPNREFRYFNEEKKDHIMELIHNAILTTCIEFEIVVESEYYKKEPNITTKEEFPYGREINYFTRRYEEVGQNNSVILRDYQIDVYEKAKLYYKLNDKSILNWPCGLGKTIISLFIARIFVETRLLIGVPSNILVQQWITEIIKLNMFPDFSFLIISSNESMHVQTTEKYLITTDQIKINEFLNTYINVIVITTYYSSNKLIPYKFDFGIYDECHHLCGTIDYQNYKDYVEISNGCKFTDILKIKCDKMLSLTATLKETHTNQIDNFNEDIFGKVLDTKTFKWAIENEYITDYRFITLRMIVDQIINLMADLKISKKNLELFLAAYMTISQAIENYNKIDKISHILCYCNTVDNAIIITSMINQIIDKIYPTFKQKIYNKSLSSKFVFNLEHEMILFKQATIGIISCVYIFGEGFDEKCFNTCVIAECMISPIRIIQSLMRANRLDNPSKIASYMCPFIDSKNDTEFKNSLINFKNIKELLIELNKIDPDIITKVKGINITSLSKRNVGNMISTNTVEFDHIETENIKMLMRHRRMLSCDNWDENEYYYYQSINKKNNITTINQYNNVKEIFETEGLEFIKDPKRYFTGKSITIWKCTYDFFGVDTSKFPQTKEELKKICLSNKITSKTYAGLYAKYGLPENPSMMSYIGYNNLCNLLDDISSDNWEY